LTAVFPAAQIDISALQHNLECVRAAAPDSKVMAVLKANAYGHELALVVSALAAADALAVARVSEGVEIRARGCQRRIVVLEGVNNSEELALAERYRAELVIHRQDQIDLLQERERSASFVIWLKLDTGMNRLGFPQAEAAVALNRLREMPQVVQPVNLMTHLASADLRSHKMSEQQIHSFDTVCAKETGELSIANSAGLLAWPASRRDWVRPGIMLYGISPFADQTGADLGLKAAMHFRTRLIAVRLVRAGECVGYGATWTAKRDTWIGTAAAGYGDGYPGNLPSGTPVGVNGQRRPLAGRVSMDMIAIDLGPDPVGRVGDTVTLWGPGIPVEEIAGLAGRLSYEVVCGVSRRVPRLAEKEKQTTRS